MLNKKNLSIEKANHEITPDSIANSVINVNHDVNNADKIKKMQTAVRTENKKLLENAYTVLISALDTQRNDGAGVSQIIKEFTITSIDLYRVVNTGSKYTVDYKTVALQLSDAERFIKKTKGNDYTIFSDKSAGKMLSIILSKIINFKSKDFNAENYVYKKAYDFGTNNPIFKKAPSINSLQEMINAYIKAVGIIDISLRRKDINIIIDNVFSAEINAQNTMQYKAKKEQFLMQCIFAAVKNIIEGAAYNINIQSKNLITKAEADKLAKIEAEKEKAKAKAEKAK